MMLRKTQRVLVSNLRETISILESLRASPRPGRGMGHITRRPVLKDGLRASEAVIVMGGKAGEFPILVKINEGGGGESDGLQHRCVPLSSTASLVFRSADEKGRLADKRFENIGLDGLSLEVADRMFGLPGEPRFSALSESSDPPETDAWHKADALGGSLASILAAVAADQNRREAALRLATGADGAALLLGDLVQAVTPAQEKVPSSAPVAVARLMFSLKESGGQDPLVLLQAIGDVLGSAGVESAKIAGFRRYMTEIIETHRSRRPADVDDQKDVFLRALSLVILRDRVQDVLLDTIDRHAPGPNVLVAAAALSGMREGLARLPSALKLPRSGIVGAFACRIEDGDCDPRAEFERVLQTAVVGPAKSERESTKPVERRPTPESCIERFGQLTADRSYTYSIGAGGVITAISETEGGRGTVELGPERVRIAAFVSRFANNALVKGALQSALDLDNNARLWLDDAGDLMLVIDLLSESGEDVIWHSLAGALRTASSWRGARRAKSRSQRSRGNSAPARKRGRKQDKSLPSFAFDTATTSNESLTIDSDIARPLPGGKEPSDEK